MLIHARRSDARLSKLLSLDWRQLASVFCRPSVKLDLTLLYRSIFFSFGNVRPGTLLWSKTLNNAASPLKASTTPSWPCICKSMTSRIIQLQLYSRKWRLSFLKKIEGFHLWTEGGLYDRGKSLTLYDRLSLYHAGRHRQYSIKMHRALANSVETTWKTTLFAWWWGVFPFESIGINGQIKFIRPAILNGIRRVSYKVITNVAAL